MSLLRRCALFLLCTMTVTSMTSEKNKNVDTSEVIVTTELGKIRGKMLTSRFGVNFYAFRGIRYAKAPVENLRFKNPMPVDSWHPDIFDATDDGPMCPQTYGRNDSSEDCLRLNVYSRNLNVTDLKPVIVYIHPGGLYSLSGQSKNFAGPQLMMDRDVVFVTLNYRLASLGFLAMNTPDAPGNAGLKDQVEALRWVKKHIVKFGGDPDLVTIVGYSAGGLSVVLHLVSPMSKNLFSRAIAMSGSGTTQWSYESNQLELAIKQANLLGCSTNNTQEIIGCLKNKTFMEFARSYVEMFEFGRGNPIYLWKPVLENDFGQERFLITDPNLSIKLGHFQKVPFLSGITKDEFVGAAIGVLKDDMLTKKFNDNFNTNAPICFVYERNSQRSIEISQKLRDAFLGNETLSLEKSIEPLGKLFSDGVIGFGVHKAVQLVAQHTKVYYYRFSYQGRYSHIYYPGNKPYGVVHHDDLLYLLAVPSMTPLFKKGDPENDTIEKLTRMWVQFAKTGNPNNKSDEFLGKLNWVPFTNDNKAYLDIGNDLEMKESLYVDRFNVWENLFPY